ncbi:T-lymphoma invasion and metastasis-inducing protein 2 [Cheilinus undulatus]|uniref:T-lymphoma invasion and metastasis-inducing protein 2 n=1 Tax=Cheilinus undulatus TaxID=241271 RepID=UPI001BD5F376|nr:T-lymphoma invasion and metastasis-inducing protein 2 [Cheilinus undulatus]XP_041667852.1 T-lymphoma invasion and metastasis-inducing protein 2 [Cheilinus undulatus]XP_041667853.1 T-lymphoma invasion and metastasis-inducing protein 2 [Cheilinus undulatus]XP_041667854.1 T-lymphoma invasion and metastasis-inducing protein 2 [Cheilinus undulatus]XP_041667855.1 T-lymphoma invasion and metastasis-inducing protein 2 [Cheilinus undulatus]XP_041667856.1 T-lymphoma invasion and metastasis-inducing p
MGNSESQYSIQGPKGTSFVFPGKQKPLKLRSGRDDSLSPQTWWRSAPVGSPYKTRRVGCLSPPKSRQPYSIRHYDYISEDTRGNPSAHHWHKSPGCGIRRRHMSDEYDGNPYGAELNGHARNGHIDEALEEQSSPRVVIKKDGSLRVEFTNASGHALLLDEASGPVQLLKFSPNLESASTPSLPGSSGSAQEGHCNGPPPASTSSTARTSKGSSLSSDGSWYDSPWGPNTDLCEADQPCSITRTLVHSPIHQLASFTEQSPPVSITDLYKDPTMSATFPTAKDLSSQFQEPPPGQRTHRASFASALDVPLEEECPEVRQYSSYTLPCRRPKAHTMSGDLEQYPDQHQQQEQAGTDFAFHKKDSIKTRIRRLSDWTGSLSRKKRKSQETRYKDLTDAFDSGVDGLTADTSSPSQVSSLLWFPGNSRAQSSGTIHQTTSDAVRQNIYENFMRELETGIGQGGGVRGGDRRDPSTGTEEGDSSSESAEGSLEQLDLLFEKEQGVVRRAGWLSFKPLVTLHKDRKLELVTRRKWKQYWVTLKGCTLLFYETYGKGSPEQDSSPRYALLAEDSIVQAVPEHPKKENVFCLSNSYGDVYLFQASNQTDLENWVTAIHSASASLLAKRQGKEDTVRLLRSQVRSLLQKIDMDGKMKKMAELQLTVVSDPKNRKAIENQIQQWEQNLERFNMDLFRMRCYLASLQGGELPNPKSLLAIASRPTKATLGRLGIFSVSSFHALICSRDEATLRRRSLSLTYRERKRGLFSSIKGLDNLTRRGRDKRPSASQIFESDAGGQTYALPPRSSERLDILTSIYSMSPPEGGVWDRINGATDVLTCVYMPDRLTVQVPTRRDQTAADLLSAACKVKQLDPSLHCLRLHRQDGQEVEVRYVAPEELLCDLVNGQLEVVPDNVFELHMSRQSDSGDFGFAVTGHIDNQKNSRIFVSEVLHDGLAFNEGLRPGDEILVLNGRCVSGLDLALIQSLFAEQTLHLSLRRNGPPPPNLTSNHSVPPLKEGRSRHHRAKSSSDVCTAAENDASLSVGLEDVHSHRAHRPVQHSKSVDTVCTLYHSFQEGTSSGPVGLMDESKDPPVRQGGGPMGEATLLRPCPKHMSATERLRKVIQELVDTEKSYVKDLTCLFKIYLKPLQNETFLTQDEMESLFGSLPEMLDFQRVFLQTLEERIASSPDFSTLETPSQFKKLLFSLGGSFLYYADHFKLYSGFCANHIKVQKVLERAKTDQAFKEFLDARNPTKQHSSTLESYLIKPVQRVLKYPLLLRELVSLTDADSEEHYHLTEALKAMEKVASHINEMQKIYEDYGSVFDQLVAEQTGHDKEVTEISMGEFLMHSSTIWLNPHPSLGRMRKDPEMTVFVFKKAVILVYRENNKLKKKMTNPRSALSHGDSDPFKFRWLIPLSALQVRLGNTAGTGTESSCIWELIHSKSEVEGRPETIFQLCSSVPESKVNIIKVIRSILRENVRRNMKSEGTLERGCRERLAPLRSTLPSSARLGSSRASWLCKQPLGDLSAQAGIPKLGPDSDEGSLSSGTHSLSGAPLPCTSSDSHDASVQQTSSQTPGSNSQPRSTSAVKESDILSDEDDDGFSEGGARRDSGDSSSPASTIEAQFLELKLSEDAVPVCPPAPCVEPERVGDTPETQHKLMRGHFSAVKRKPNSFRRSQGALLNMKAHSRSLDSQTDTALPSGVVDLNTLLEREFSVQSLASVVNEDCFYDQDESCATDSGHTTSS